MQRRNFLKSAALGATLRPAPFNALADRPPGHRPNFLFMIADDLTYRSIRALNNNEVKTPNLDRLVRNGASFTNCFHQGSWSGAVCVPSRTMLNSGLSAFHAEENFSSVPLWGQTLGNAGYRTYMVGKWHLDPTSLQRSFQNLGPVSGGMFESTPDAYHRPRPGDNWSPTNEALGGHWLHTNLWLNSKQDQIRHSCSIWSSCAAEHLRHAASGPSGDPFFMYIGFNEPHDPRQSPREFIDMYPQEQIEIPPNYLPEHPFDQGDREVRDELLAPFPRTKDAVRLHRAEYYALISYLDKQVGVILDALERSGKAANTYVIFTADHGLAVGQHGLMGKQNMYDHSVRIPLIVTGPGVPRGKQVDDLVYQHSVYPTTCQLAGIRIPDTVEFPSLAHYLQGGGGPSLDAVFCYYRDFQRAVRTSDHKLIVYPKAKTMQLFDLRNDPWEIHNLAANPQYRSIRDQLMARLRDFQAKLGDKLLLDNQTGGGAG